MNKKVFMLLIMLLATLFFSLPSASADGLEKQQAVYTLPLSLLKIEDEAFSNTAAEKLIFPDGLVYIGEEAFSDAWKLTVVYIPETTKYIADTAVPNNASIEIHGINGSYAEDWAKKRGIPFVEENIWRPILDNGNTVSIQELGVDFFYRTVNPKRIIKIVPRAEDEDESKRPQDRPELNPIDYRFP